MRVRLGVNTGFAINRYPDADDWVSIVADELGLDTVQFTADLLNPSLGESIVLRQVDLIRTLCDAKVVRVEKKPRVEQPKLLFDLTQLQREANSQFGFTAKRTLAAAQSLYDTHKLLTYPRTNSKYLTSDMVDSLRGIVKDALAAYCAPRQLVIVETIPKTAVGKVRRAELVRTHH